MFVFGNLVTSAFVTPRNFCSWECGIRSVSWVYSLSPSVPTY